MASAPEKINEVKAHQHNLSDELIAILSQSNHAYLEAPPASGKTLTIAMAADRLSYQTAYYLTHTLDLVDQAKKEIQTYRRSGLISDRVAWHFMTRQTYVNLARSGRLGNSEGHVAFVDECHMGGTANNQPKVQIPIITDSAEKVVWISATPWDLDEESMGQREGATSQLPFDEAFELGILNDTDVIRVDCSLDLKVKLSDDSRALKRAQEDEYHIIGNDAVDQHRQLSALTRDVENRGLRVSDVPTIVHFRHRLMADLYLSLHRGEKAIFWLPTRQHARDCADYLCQMTGKDSFAVSILGENRGSAEYLESQKDLEQWKRAAGKSRVACAVFRLREGFDYPELGLGFDCSWNPDNPRNAVQKIGRLTRTAPGKRQGRYYYAVDAVTIAGAQTRHFSSRFMQRLGRDWTEEDVSFMSDAFEQMTSLLKAAGVTDRQPFLPFFRHAELSGRNVRLARSALFDILRAAGISSQEPTSFEDLMQSAASAAVEKLVADIEAGKREMPDINSRGEGNMLRRKIHKSSRSYDPAIRARLIRCGAINPRNETARERLFRLVDDIESGRVMLKSGDENHRFLFKYINPTNRTYRADIRERLTACGAIRSKAEFAAEQTAKRKARQERVAMEETKRADDRVQDIAKDLIAEFEVTLSTLISDVKKARTARLRADRYKAN